MPTTLNNEQLKQLHAWLSKKGISCAGLGQRFSDGTELAKLLKLMYPKKVELHNYSSCSSTPAKIANWNTLNFKILTKLQIPQSKSNIDELSKGRNSAVESLLFKIMTLEKTTNENIMKNCGNKEKPKLADDDKMKKKAKSKDNALNKNCDNTEAQNVELPADEQKIIAELCKELQIDRTKDAL